MSNGPTKISDLPAATSLNPADLFAIVQSGTTKQWSNAIGGGLAFYVANVAALKALTPPTAAMLVATEGYYTAGDGGAGTYWWNSTDTTADNGGTVIALTTGGIGRFNLVERPFSFKQFGAQYNGSDDSAYINAALSAAAAGEEVIVDFGAFSANVTIASKSVVLRGQATSSQLGTDLAYAIWSPYNSAAPTLQIGNDTAYVRVIGYNIVIDGNNTAQMGLYFYGGASYCEFYNSYVGRFTTYCVKQKGGVTYPALMNRFFGGNVLSDNGNCDVVYADGTAVAPSYSNTLQFHGTMITGPSQAGTGHAIRNDSMASMYVGSGAYVQCYNLHGVKFEHNGAVQPYIVGGGAAVDSGSSTDILLESDTDVSPVGLLRGNITVDGLFQSPAGTSAALTGCTFNYNGYYLYPFVIGATYYHSTTTNYGSFDQTDTGTNIARSGNSFLITNNNGYIAATHVLGSSFYIWSTYKPALYLTATTGGEKTAVLQNYVSVGSFSGATATFTAAIPAGSLVLGVTSRVSSTINGPTSISIGDGTTVDAFAHDSTGLAVGSTTDLTSGGTLTSPKYYGTATNIIVTANGGNFTSGAMRVVVHYVALTAPTA